MATRHRLSAQLAEAPDTRTLPWDWYAGRIPDNVILGDDAYLESTYSFFLYRSNAPTGLRMGKAASAYLGTMFDVGPNGSVTMGEYSLVHAARIICEESVEIGSYTLISWNVVLMDSYRLPVDRQMRREVLRSVPHVVGRFIGDTTTARPIRIGSNVWIGFDCCVLPGVTIGDGAIVGARSVVTADVEPYTIVAGNPARLVRRIDLENEK